MILQVEESISADRQMVRGWFAQVKSGKEAKRKIVEYLDSHPKNRLLVLQEADRAGVLPETINKWRLRYCNQQLNQDNCPTQVIDSIEEPSAPMAVHYSSDSAEWYTPPEIIERTTKAMGRIDLDPCSPDVATIPAATTFTKDADGLRFDWCGNVYMNPPYGREIGEWVTKLVGEYQAGRTKEAIALVPARVDTDWFRQFRDFAICFIDGRLKFSGHDNSAPFPSAVVYLGADLNKFSNAFDDIGDIWVRWRE